MTSALLLAISMSVVAPTATTIVPTTAPPSRRNAQVAGTSVAPVPKKAPAETVALRFAWPAEGEVPVVETRKKPKSEVEIGYRLRWRTRTDRSIEVDAVDLAVVAIDRVPASDPRLAAKRAQREPLLRAIPKSVVSPDGAFTGTEGYDARIEALITSLAALRDRPDEIEALTRTFSSPGVRSTIEEKCVETWNTWVASWNGLDLPVGAEAEYTSGIRIDGELVPTTTTVACRRTFDDGGAHCAELVSETVLRGDAVTRHLSAMLVRNGGKLPEGGVQSATKATLVTGVYEIAGLRPRTVSRSSTTSFDTAAGAVEFVESTSYAFDWTKYHSAAAARVESK